MPLAPFTLLTLFLAGLSTSLAHSHDEHEPVVRSPGFEKRQSVYPQADVPGPTPKAEWIATYNAAKAAGKIPAVPVASMVNGNPSYPAGTVTGKGGACSWTLAHCFGAYDVVDAPTGIWGVSFDDGPQLASPPLYDFLKANNQKATHFMIGSRILDNPSIFQQAVQQGEHIAVHTWSHHYMTTLTDMQILGELGWTAQIIYDYSGGLVPSFWRPPYGDIDDRVRGIAEQVFGMYSVVWNGDSFDWCLGENNVNNCVNAGPGTDAGLDTEFQNFMAQPKSPGVILLEHELTSRSVGGFMRYYPQLAGKQWTPKAIPDIWSVNWYLNAARTDSQKDPSILIGSGANPFVSGGNSNAATNSSSASLIPSLTSVASSNSTTAGIATPTSFGVNVTATSTATSVSDMRTAPPASALSAATTGAVSTTAAPTSKAAGADRFAASAGAVVVLGAAFGVLFA